MSKGKRKVNVKIVKGRDPADTPITKSDVSTQITDSEKNYAGEWLQPPVDLRGYKETVNNSSILPQCIHAYKHNIAGFGIGVRYKEDVKENPEMAAEFERAQHIIELLTTEQDTKEVFEDIIEARETYGIAYIEVIRNLGGEVVQIEFIKNTPSVRKTLPLEPYIDTEFFYNGEKVTRKKKFCKYQQTVSGKTVYFREFGDQRIMDKRSGVYLQDGDTLPLEYQANEIIEFAIGTEPYGEVRWTGQILGIDGSRKAEALNYNYFINGRHTPLMILLQGGSLTNGSYEKLQEYMNDIKGENGQHAFIVLEAESNDGRTDWDATETPHVEIKDLASILQKDELFQEYLNNGRKKVQSAFQLPDLYVGYTTDFNRATAQTAQEVTEKQVFQPERKSLAWIVNNKLLNCYQFKYVEAYFKDPDITNPDDLHKLLSICNAAGGLTPNKAKEIALDAFGETSEDYPEEWGNIPIAISRSQNAGTGTPIDPTAQLLGELEKQIEKATNESDVAIVAVMKEVKKVLKNLKKDFTFRKNGSIIKEGWITTEEGNHVFLDGDGTFHGGASGYEAFTASQTGGDSTTRDSGGTQAPEHHYRSIDIESSEVDELKEVCGYASVEDQELMYDRDIGYIHTSSCHEINEFMRGERDVITPEKLDTIDALDRVIGQNQTDRDLILTRFVDTPYLESVFGLDYIPYGNEEEIVDYLNDTYKGETLPPHRGYLSTSYDPEQNFFRGRPIEIEILTPKGTHMYMTDNDDEAEALLGDGVQFSFKGAEVKSYDSIKLTYEITNDGYEDVGG